MLWLLVHCLACVCSPRPLLTKLSRSCRAKSCCWGSDSRVEQATPTDKMAADPCWGSVNSWRRVRLGERRRTHIQSPERERHTYTLMIALTHAHTHTHARIHTHAYTHTHTYTRTHTHTHARTHARARTHAHTHTPAVRSLLCFMNSAALWIRPLLHMLSAVFLSSLQASYATVANARHKSATPLFFWACSVRASPSCSVKASLTGEREGWWRAERRSIEFVCLFVCLFVYLLWVTA